MRLSIFILCLFVATATAEEARTPAKFPVPTNMDIIHAGISTIHKAVYYIKQAALSTSIKDVFNKGFRHYESTAQIEIGQGISKEGAMKFLTSNIVKKMNANPSILDGIEAALRIGLSAEPNTWHDVKIVFSEGQPETRQVQFVNIIITDRGDSKFNIVVASVAPFQLASGVKYIRNSVSHVGGFYSDTRVERSEFSSELVDSDLQALTGFFHIIVFRKLAAAFNLPSPHLPDKLPLKPYM